MHRRARALGNGRVNCNLSCALQKHEQRLTVQKTESSAVAVSVTVTQHPSHFSSGFRVTRLTELADQSQGISPSLMIQAAE